MASEKKASEILLVNVAGVDKPGLMAMVTSRLAQYQARILDVGQAVIHDTLGLGFLVELPDAAQRESLEKELLIELQAESIPTRFTTISRADYADWVAGHVKPRYILTVLAQQLSAQQLAAISAITRDQGLNIETVRRLSRSVAVDAPVAEQAVSSIEIGLRGAVVDQQHLKVALLQQAGELAFDFSLQLDTVYRRNRRLVAFDMDSTLIKMEVIDELARAHGVFDQVAAITARAMAGELDFQQSFRERAALLKGMPASRLAEIAEAVVLNDGAQRLIDTLRHFGYKVAVISGGFQYVGESLRERLGIDYVFANTLEIVDGVMTGEVEGRIVDAQRKAELLKQIADSEQVDLEQVIAIGDGANDLPMLGVAGLGVAYHAKPVVKRTAHHAISNFGLDSLLYLLGFTDRDIEQALATRRS